MTTTFRDRVAAVFLAHPGEWVSAYTLMEVGGRMAWRTRCSECRVQLGMAIENRTRKQGRQTISEYRYTPPAQTLLEIMEAS
jgi:hypothetical protein